MAWSSPPPWAAADVAPYVPTLVLCQRAVRPASHQPNRRTSSGRRVIFMMRRKRGDFVDRRSLGQPQLRVDLGERHLVRARYALHQNALLAVLDPGDRHHGGAARQLVKMRPGPSHIDPAQDGLVSCDEPQPPDKNS